MFKIHSLGSSSKGNCFVINDGISTILLDAGMPSKTIQLGLFKLNIKLSEVNGILITHSHQDHLQGINALKSCKKYMTKGTFETNEYKNDIKKDEVILIKEQETFQVGSFSVKAFKTKHDAKESVGFVIKNNSNERLLYLTDTGIANVNFKNAEVYIIEANHSEEFMKNDLEKGLIDEMRYKRVTENHLSVEKTIKYLKKNIGDKTNKIILMHMSPRNKYPIKTMNFVRKQLDTNIVDFIHPINHKIKNGWEVGYKPKRKRGF